MIRRLVVLFLLDILLLNFFTSHTYAQTPWPTVSPTNTPKVEYTLPYAGILPDHPLYFLKKLRDNILIFITRSPLKKSQLYLLLSDKSLVMSNLLWDKGNYERSSKTLMTGEKYLLQSVMVLYDVTDKDQDIPPGMADKLELAAKKHEEVIAELVNKGEESSQLSSIKEALSITHQAIQKITTLKSL